MRMTTYVEPIIRQSKSDPNKANALAVGYTYTADYHCLKNDINLFDNRPDSPTAGRFFANARVSFVVNPFQGFNPPRCRRADTDTENLMKNCCQVLGSRCVLGNNSVRAVELSAKYNAT